MDENTKKDFDKGPAQKMRKNMQKMRENVERIPPLPALNMESLGRNKVRYHHPNVPPPVAQLKTNSLLLVQPLEVHPDTLH